PFATRRSSDLIQFGVVRVWVKTDDGFWNAAGLMWVVFQEENRYRKCVIIRQGVVQPCCHYVLCGSRHVDIGGRSNDQVLRNWGQLQPARAHVGLPSANQDDGCWHLFLGQLNDTSTHCRTGTRILARI